MGSVGQILASSQLSTRNIIKKSEWWNNFIYWYYSYFYINFMFINYKIWLKIVTQCYLLEGNQIT
jgi:hypothetical protein